MDESFEIAACASKREGARSVAPKATLLACTEPPVAHRASGQIQYSRVAWMGAERPRRLLVVAPMSRVSSILCPCLPHHSILSHGRADVSVPLCHPPAEGSTRSVVETVGRIFYREDDDGFAWLLSVFFVYT